jgi:hypothetical protein
MLHCGLFKFRSGITEVSALLGYGGASLGYSYTIVASKRRELIAQRRGHVPEERTAHVFYVVLHVLSEVNEVVYTVLW